MSIIKYIKKQIELLYKMYLLTTGFKLKFIVMYNVKKKIQQKLKMKMNKNV